MIYTNPIAVLFCNGTAKYFDTQDNLIIDLNIKGWKGIHTMLKTWPHTEVYMQGAGQLTPDMIEFLIKHVKRPKNVKKIRAASIS